MKALNNKIQFRLLPPEQQPQKSSLNPNADALKKAEVLSVGHKVLHIKEGDIITLYYNDIMIAEEGIGYCGDGSPLFINERPQPNKTQIRPKNSDKISKFSKATVISTTDENINPGDEIGYKKGSGIVLPDKSEIISDTQIFYKD